MAAALSAACEKPAAVAPPPPPEVYVATVVQQDVPVYLDLVGQTQGFQDVEIRARVEGFLDTRELPRRVVRSQGRSPLSDRPEAAPGRARAGECGQGTGSRSGDRPGAARKGQQRRRPLHAARRQAGRQPAGARRRAGSDAGVAVARGRRSKRPRPRWTRRRSISATCGSRRRSTGWSARRW